MQVYGESLRKCEDELESGDVGEEDDGEGEGEASEHEDGVEEQVECPGTHSEVA